MPAPQGVNDTGKHHDQNHDHVEHHIEGADFTIKNIPRSIKMIDPKIDVNCNFWDFDSNLIYLSNFNHLIHKKYTNLFGIQLSMLVSLICPYSQEPDH
jgi:hypothetical protein